MKKSLAGLMLAYTLSAVTFAFGQSATTSLRGTIKDPSGAFVPGAKITIENKEKGRVFSAVSDSSGLYTFPQIPPAKYTITANAPASVTSPRSAELAGQSAGYHRLHPLRSRPAVKLSDVSATCADAQHHRCNARRLRGERADQAMPMDGRDPISLLSSQPGALYLGETTSDGGQDGSRGSR